MISDRVHGTCVALDGRAALLRGPSGSGKSDLALRLIERGAVLVADDQVMLEPTGTEVIACCEPRLAGRLEVRGVGILEVPHVASAPLVAIFDLVSPEAVPRLPEPDWEEFSAGARVRRFAISPFEASAPQKVGFLLGAAGAIDPSNEGSK